MQGGLTEPTSSRMEVWRREGNQEFLGLQEMGMYCRNVQEDSGLEEPGSEEKVQKLWPGAVTGSGCQGTSPEDR